MCWRRLAAGLLSSLDTILSLTHGWCSSPPGTNHFSPAHGIPAQHATGLSDPARARACTRIHRHYVLHAAIARLSHPKPKRWKQSLVPVTPPMPSRAAAYDVVLLPARRWPHRGCAVSRQTPLSLHSETKSFTTEDGEASGDTASCNSWVRALTGARACKRIVPSEYAQRLKLFFQNSNPGKPQERPTLE